MSYSTKPSQNGEVRAEPPGFSSPEATLHWELVERVAASRYFRRSKKLSAFLLYISQNALLGRRDEIREQLIGHRVFGRALDYSINEDNIVRVEARELRKRLEQYFAEEGSAETTVVTVPKGGYLPLFQARQAPAGPPETEMLEGVPAATSATRSRLLLGFCLVLLIAVAVLAHHNFSRQHELLVADGDAGLSIYTDLLGAPAADFEYVLVIGNPRVLMYYGSDKPNVANPMDSEPLLSVPTDFDRELGAVLNLGDDVYPYRHLKVTVGAYTAVSAAVAAFHLGRLMQNLGREIRIEQGRFLTWQSARNKNLILLAPPNAGDWTYKYSPRMNFSYITDGIVNHSPLPGEEKTYWIDSSTDYGTISMARLASGSRVLSITGRSTGAAAGVAEFFCDPERMSEVHARILAAAGKGGFPDTWEVLIRADVRERLPVNLEVVSVRVGVLSQG